MQFSLKYFLPVLVYLLFIFFLSSLSNTGISVSFDKESLTLHILEYSILGLLMLRAFSNSNPGYPVKYLLLISIAVSAFYGVTDEFHQAFVPGRNSSLIDLSADSLGSVWGSLIYLLVRKRN